ncbi:reverse transcriptase family protein [Jiulongibacter sediminis]|uniref:reverse transcriptase family protein n=1 Tax=Jiulongibacter sediminis TaxID=1605367 RepID=UPI0026EDD7B7|nr:reverse transcriptase family protein [Jiulongibacter sediminis]
MNYHSLIQHLGHNAVSWKQLLENGISYSSFKLPKNNGKMRLIEAPAPELKRTQKLLSHLLYTHYLPHAPESVHGFIRMKNAPRSILSNAKAHLGRKFMTNIDLKDFYHQIEQQKTECIIWEAYPWLLPAELDTLLKVVLKDNRLPMGAPSSSVLSNMAFLECDKDLEEYALKSKLTYTRYVDDLTFSGNQSLSEAKVSGLLEIIRSHGFRENPNKIKHYSEDEVKVITGIAMDGLKLSVDEDLKKRLLKNIKELKKLNQIKSQLKFMGIKPENNSRIKTLNRAIKGQLEFVKQIEGQGSPYHQQLAKALQNSSKEFIDINLSVYF